MFTFLKPYQRCISGGHRFYFWKIPQSMHHIIVMKCADTINMLRWTGEEQSIIKVSDIKNTN